MDQQGHLEKLLTFLANATSNWTYEEIIRKHVMGNGETIACVKWKEMFYITGTDIVKILLYRFLVMGRQVLNMKKFEEGIFSDLRNLKSGQDAILEEPRSEFLELLYKNGCIRTQKKQKVFFWHSVHHQRLFEDARDRDVKREQNLLSVSNSYYGYYMAGVPYGQPNGMMNQHLGSPQQLMPGNQMPQMGMPSIAQQQHVYSPRASSMHVIQQQMQMEQIQQRHLQGPFLPCPAAPPPSMKLPSNAPKQSPPSKDLKLDISEAEKSFALQLLNTDIDLCSILGDSNELNSLLDQPPVRTKLDQESFLNPETFLNFDDDSLIDPKIFMPTFQSQSSKE